MHDIIWFGLILKKEAKDQERMSPWIALESEGTSDLPWPGQKHGDSRHGSKNKPRKGMIAMFFSMIGTVYQWKIPMVNTND